MLQDRDRDRLRCRRGRLRLTVQDGASGSVTPNPNGKPVAYVNVSPHGAVDAHDSLVKVLAKIGTKLVSEACQPIPVTRDQVGADGLVHDPEIRARLTAALDVLAAQ